MESQREVGGAVKQDYFGLSGRWTAERAVGGQKRLERGEESTVGQRVRGDH